MGFQTKQSGEIMSQAEGWRLQAGLLWRSIHFHSGNHNIQNLDQHQYVNKGRIHDDDGKYKLLLGHPSTYI